MKNINIHVQEYQHSSHGINTKKRRNKSRYLVLQLLNTGNREKILKVARGEKETYLIQKDEDKKVTDFISETK